MRHRSVFLAIAPLLLLAAPGEASTSDRTPLGQTFLGHVSDPRVQRCGVVISGGAELTVRPFVQASAGLKGFVELQADKISNSGRSMVSQSGRFSGDQMDLSGFSVDRPDRLVLTMTLSNADRQPLCRLTKTVSFPSGNEEDDNA